MQYLDIFFPPQCFLITGSIDQDSKLLLFNDLFRINKYQDKNIFDYNVEGNYRITEYGKLNSSEYNEDSFRKKILELSSNKKIICIGNLFPRPETLLNDLKILVDHFSEDELKKSLYLFFTQSNCPKELKDIRSSFLDKDNSTLFELLKIVEPKSKEEFVNERIWILDKIHLPELQSISFIDKYLNAIGIKHDISHISDRATNIKETHISSSSNFEENFENKDENKNELSFDKIDEVLLCKDCRVKYHELNLETFKSKDMFIEAAFFTALERCKDRCYKNIDSVLISDYFEHFETNEKFVVFNILDCIENRIHIHSPQSSFKMVINELSSKNSLLIHFLGSWEISSEFSFYKILFSDEVKTLFYNLKNISAFVILIKCEERVDFTSAAQLFKKIYGPLGIQRLLILGMQNDENPIDNEEVKNSLRKKGEYNKLNDILKKYSNSEASIPVCLWNKSSPLQIENMIECLEQIKRNTSESEFELLMKFSFNNIENEIKSTKKIINLEERSNELRNDLSRSICTIL